MLPIVGCTWIPASLALTPLCASFVTRAAAACMRLGRRHVVRLLVLSCALTVAEMARAQSNYEPYPFGTFAGKGGALFSVPAIQGGLAGIAIDAGGSVYVADIYNDTIRKISPAGTVITYAGSAGNAGSVDGDVSVAQFNGPYGVAADAVGNVYVSDTGNNTIRKITSAGTVSTVAGLAGNSGSVDGNGNAARFNSPQGIAVDGAGNLYVGDAGNRTIRKISPAGDVTTLAGLAGTSGSADGNGTSARFSFPGSVTVDGFGNVYVADRNNHTIRKITPAGDVTTWAGLAGNSGSTDANGGNARFNYPSGVSVDSGDNLYVPDGYNHTVRKITPSGDVTTLTGLAGVYGTADANGTAARFFYPPGGVAVGSSGIVYVSDGLNTIRKITPARDVITFAGSADIGGSDDGTGGNQRFSSPTYVAVDHDGYVYVADNNAVRKVSPSGIVTIFAGSPGPGNFGSGYAEGFGGAAQFAGVGGIAADSAGNIYVADNLNVRIRKITPDGNVTTLVDVNAANAAGFYSPFGGLAVDSTGYIFFADTGSHTVYKIAPNGTVTAFAGYPFANPGSVDGTGSAARFNSPNAVAVDSAGYVYVTDTNNHTIRKITPSGVVSTLAGTAGFVGSADGTGSAASFRYPSGVAVDSTGNVYVVDTGTNTIRKITPAGLVTTLAGSTGVGGNIDGIGSVARFSSPNGVAVDGAGYLYVVDGSTVRLGGPAAVTSPTPSPTAAPTPTPTPTPISADYYFASPTYETFKNAGSVTITVTRSGDISQAASVACKTDSTYSLQYNLLTYGARSKWYSLSTGDAQFQHEHQAIAGQEYTSFNGSANFQPNQSSTTVSIALLNSGALSGRRDFRVALNAYPLTAGPPTQVFILDEQTTLQISSGSATPAQVAPNLDYTRSFVGNLKVLNTGPSSTGPLRIKLIAHADYNNPPEHPINPTPTLPPDVVLGAFDVTSSLDGFGASENCFVYGVTPAPGGNPYSYNYWFWVYAVVEEQVGSIWHSATTPWLLVEGARFATGKISDTGSFQNYGTPCPPGQSCDNGGSTGSTGSWGGGTIFLPPGQPFVISSLTFFSNGHLLLKGIGTPKATYTIQNATSPSPSSFVTLGPATVDSTGLFKYEDVNASSFTKRFYRATSP